MVPGGRGMGIEKKKKKSPSVPAMIPQTTLRNNVQAVSVLLKQGDR